MSTPAPLIVVKRGRLAIVVSVGVVLVIAAYLLGRAGIGLLGPEPLADEAELRDAIRERDATIRELRRSAAELETLRASQSLERRELSRTVKELQDQVAQQRQQLQVFQNVVSRGDTAPGIVLRSATLLPGSRPQERILRVALAQSETPRGEVSGRLQVFIEGRRAGRVERLAVAEMPYRFRYVSNFETPVSAPEGLSIDQVVIVILPEQRGTRPVIGNVTWQ
ncbi:MAG: DUF6776 family protein [Steroidobacteraceae bacterium]